MLNLLSQLWRATLIRLGLSYLCVKFVDLHVEHLLSFLVLIDVLLQKLKLFLILSFILQVHPLAVLEDALKVYN